MATISLDFNGTTDVVGPGTITSLGTTPVDYTLGAWVNADTAGEGNLGMIINLVLAGGDGFYLSLGVGMIVAAFQNMTTTGADSQSTDTLTAGTWYCVIATFRSSDKKLRLYIGTAAGAMAEVTYGTQVAGVGNFASAAVNARVGNNPSGAFTFDGRISQAFLTNRELSTTEMDLFRIGDWTAIYSASVTPNFFLPLENTVTSEIARNISFGVTGATLTANPPAGAYRSPAGPTRTRALARVPTRRGPSRSFGV